MKSQPLWLALLCSALIQPLQAAPLSPMPRPTQSIRPVMA